MNKWYRSCGWMLVAAMAIQLTGCARHRTWLSAGVSQQATWLGSFPMRESGGEQLASAGGTMQPKTETSCTGEPLLAAKDNSTDSKLAKESSLKPKSASSESSRVEAASAKEAAVAQKTPELLKETPESLEPVADLDFGFEDVEPSDRGAQKQNVARSSASEIGQRDRAVASSAEEDFDDLSGLSEWEMLSEKPSAKAEIKHTAPAIKASVATGAKKVVRSTDQAQRKIDNRKQESAPVSPVAAVESRPREVDLLSLCPEAQGELREQIRALNTSDVEVLKHRLGRIGTETAAAPALEQLLKHKDGLVKMHAAFALARMQQSTPEGVRIVVNGLKSADPGQRSFAAATIAEMGPQLGVALEAFADSLDNRDQDGNFRFEDAEVLIRVKPRSQGSKNPPIRKFAVPEISPEAPGYSRLLEPAELTEPEEETTTPVEETTAPESEASVSVSEVTSEVTIVRQRVQKPNSSAVGRFSVVK